VRFVIISVLWAALSSTGIYASQESESPCVSRSSDGVVILASSKTRFADREKCFAKEHVILKKYRINQASVKKQESSSLQQMVGLALSGGGIKSSAFQLGLLSGLHLSKNGNDAPLLYEVDYISSVSGGSWANGAYVSAPVSDEALFSCLREIASADEVSARCEPLTGLLPDRQNKIKGSGDWQQQIVDSYLQGKSLSLDAVREQHYREPKRPFPLFLATHSSKIKENKDAENFPFEFTPLSIGTIADCDTPETPCGFFRKYLRPLHWNNSPERGFVLELAQAQGVLTKVQKYGLYEPADKLLISHAMWASGALISKVFSLHLHIDKNDEKIEGVRKKYVLSDGGKADNIGLIPLVERGADLIILSQIAGDANSEFGDLERSTAQVKRLFGVDVETEALLKPHKKDGDSHLTITTGCFDNGKGGVSSIILIKPTVRNLAGFYASLKRSRYAKLMDFLKQEISSDKSMRFPQNDTIELGYPKQLIYSYFALGEYIGQTGLSRELNRWLAGAGGCAEH